MDLNWLSVPPFEFLLVFPLRNNFARKHLAGFDLMRLNCCEPKSVSSSFGKGQTSFYYTKQDVVLSVSSNKAVISPVMLPKQGTCFPRRRGTAGGGGAGTEDREG